MIRGAIFAGGSGTRMEGRKKGFLRAPDGEPIVARWVRLFDEIGVPAVFVGGDRAYGNHLRTIDDAVRGIGPIGGLLAVLREGGTVVAVACDMPFVTRDLLAKLAFVESPAPIVAAKREGRFEPFFARYEAIGVLAIVERRVAAGLHAMSGVLGEANAEELALSREEHALLRDWDTPDDVAAGGGHFA